MEATGGSFTERLFADRANAMINRSLAMTAALSGTGTFASNCLFQRRQAMDEIDYLRDQAERAERLSSCINDPLTTERLKSFAGECRRRMALLAPAARRAA
jgi:hypothetical protein